MSGRIIFLDKLGDELWLVARVLDVTVNVFEAELDPWVATTGTDPIDDEGTVKLAKNAPLVLVVTVAGFVVIAVPLIVIVTVELEPKEVPVISTEVPTGPEVGLIEMPGLSFIGPTVNCFEITLAEILWGPGSVLGTVILAVNSPLLLVVTVAGSVATSTASNFIATGMLGAKPVPVIVTVLPTGPPSGSSTMANSALPPLNLCYSRFE
jgi:hypothetical protein